MGRPAGVAGPYSRHCSASAPTPVEHRMATALCRHIINLGDPVAVAALLRRAGFRLMDIEQLADQAAAIARSRSGRR